MAGKRFHLAILASVLLLGSCSDSALFSHEVVVIPPHRPEAWRDLVSLEFYVSWEDSAGISREALLLEGQDLRIRLKRGEFCAVVARAFSGNDRLRSAAAFYPRDLAMASERTGFLASLGLERLRLDFMRGYLAEVADCLGKIGKNPWIYPLERMGEELSLRRADPWSVPPDETAEALALHGFRIDKYLRKGTDTTLPKSSGWVPESPFSELKREGDVQKVLLPEGLSIFYDENRKLIASVREDQLLFQILPRTRER
jgi:hypothetical protein